MARVETVTRASTVFEIYKRLAPDLEIVELHTGIKGVGAREEARRKILTKEARIVVCVDMLGEGFDLPELKIAAFHDIRKTLSVTLQLAGRFVRARPDLGDATFVANTADLAVQNELSAARSRRISSRAQIISGIVGAKTKSQRVGRGQSVVLASDVFVGVDSSPSAARPSCGLPWPMIVLLVRLHAPNRSSRRSSQFASRLGCGGAGSTRPCM